MASIWLTTSRSPAAGIGGRPRQRLVGGGFISAVMMNACRIARPKNVLLATSEIPCWIDTVEAIAFNAGSVGRQAPLWRSS